MPKLAIGLDFGTSSVRALVVDIADGREVATSVFDYPSGDAGVILSANDPNLARQHPKDWTAGLESTLRAVLAQVDPADVCGVGVDTTGSSPLPVDAHGAPLAFDPRWNENLAALCWLWKDHTAYEEAAEITALARKLDRPYLAKCGGTYSSEWFWSKVLHCARTSPEVFDAAHAWVEMCDWIVGELVGNTDPLRMSRSVCAAGHKAMYSDAWGGLPDEAFLERLDPRLPRVRRSYAPAALPSSNLAGGVSATTAARTGLRPGTPVAVGAFDAHFGAVGSGVRPGVLVKIVGTSTCDCMVHPLEEPLADIPGLCGIVPGSILPNCYGLEAGQSAVGDLFNWVTRLTGKSHEELSRDAAKLRPGTSGLLALDWNNGNRTILVDPRLSGLLVGQTLHTTPAEVYRAVIEATAFGALTIIRRLEEHGVKVQEVVNCGGIAEKNPLVMQTYADVCDRPMRVSRSGQTCALGGAIFGAVVGGGHPTVEAAQERMTGVQPHAYLPNPSAVAVYRRLYRLYMQLHDGFGGVHNRGDLGEVMKELIQIREDVRAEV